MSGISQGCGGLKHLEEGCYEYDGSTNDDILSNIQLNGNVIIGMPISFLLNLVSEIVNYRPITLTSACLSSRHVLIGFFTMVCKCHQFNVTTFCME
ncbi:hypothetical protein Dsin_008098 [Dipteronia sinensis]|uniref:Uncharacterized protein n=1 Tax=Dipteronia sinensis TaxID=43782 RepID=A0AAE0B1E1_9ROSI|nr:hypothetical protein Dsin_008098 [Dipteronia sinensis]